MPFYAFLTFGLLAASGNLLGGFLVTRSAIAKGRWLKSLMAIGGGFMLAAVVLELIPVALEQAAPNVRRALGLLLAGYLTLFILSRWFDGHAHGNEPHAATLLELALARRILVALMVHSFFDGVTIASGLLVSRELGFLLLVAALLHKIPEGFTVASVLLGAGSTQMAALRASALIAAATMAGVLSILILHPSVLYTLPFAAGVTFYVVATDLIPEVTRSRGWTAGVEIGIGIGLFYGTHLLLDATGLK